MPVCNWFILALFASPCLVRTVFPPFFIPLFLTRFSLSVITHISRTCFYQSCTSGLILYTGQEAPVSILSLVLQSWKTLQGREEQQLAVYRTVHLVLLASPSDGCPALAVRCDAHTQSCCEAGCFLLEFCSSLSSRSAL